MDDVRSMADDERRFIVDDKSLEVYNMMDKRLIGSDLILMVLSPCPLVGNYTIIHTIVFFTWKELLYDVSFDPIFLPSPTGPYSYVISESLNVLVSKKEMKIENVSPYYRFSITEMGKNKILNKLAETGISFKERIENKISYDYTELREYVHSKYPEYLSNTSTQ